MRLALLACCVMQRELSCEIAHAPATVRVWWLKQGLHDTPEILRRQLQAEIDRLEEENALLPACRRYDAICLGYGLCSNSILGLKAGALPLVVPRCDDCISLFLGSRKRYLELFERYPGTYWYNPGWLEHGFAPTKENFACRFADYVERYGEENAAYLQETETAWIGNYKSAVYIDSPVCDNDAGRKTAEQAAADFGWQFHREPGSQRLIEKLLSGNWDKDEFILCPPGQTLTQDL